MNLLLHLGFFQDFHFWAVLYTTAYSVALCILRHQASLASTLCIKLELSSNAQG